MMFQVALKTMAVQAYDNECCDRWKTGWVELTRRVSLILTFLIVLNSLLLLPLYPFTPFPSCRACGSDLDLSLNWSSKMPPKAQCGNPLWLSWMEGNPQLHIVWIWANNQNSEMQPERKGWNRQKHTIKHVNHLHSVLFGIIALGSWLLLWGSGIRLLRCWKWNGLLIVRIMDYLFPGIYLLVRQAHSTLIL